MLKKQHSFFKACLLTLVISFSTMQCAHNAPSFFQGATRSCFFATGLSPLFFVLQRHFTSNDEDHSIEQTSSNYEKIYSFQSYSAKEYKQLQSYAQKELQDLGLSSIPVYLDTGSYARPTYIAVSHRTAFDAFYGLCYHKGSTPTFNTSDQGVQKFKGILHHEAYHILHKDYLRTSIALASISLLSVFGFARFGFKNASALRILALTPINCFVQINLNLAFSRRCEQQADDAITDPDAIRGLILHLKEVDIQLKEDDSHNPWELWYKQYASTHPLPASRIANLEQRLQEIEKTDA